MSEDIVRVKSRLTTRFIFSNFLLVICIVAVWYVLSEVIEMEATYVLPIALLVGLIVALLLSFLQREFIFKPLITLQRAVMHVTSAKADAPPPEIKSSFLGNDLTSDLVKKIYDLAAMSQGAAKDLQHRFDLLRAVVDGAPTALIGLSKQQNVLYANHAGQKQFNRDYRQALGQPLSEVLQLEFSGQQTYEQWLANARLNKIRDVHGWQRITVIQPDHTKRMVDLLAAYNKEDSHGFETVLTIIDRTHEYQADESQMDFVAVAAHELRTPITILRGYLDALDEQTRPSLTAQQVSLLEKVIVSSEQLAGYINNILSVARIDQNGLNLHLREEDWLEIIKDAYAKMSARAKAHGRILKLKAPDSLPPVAVDRVGIMMVLNNLVDNAIKYSRDGGEITITVNHNQQGMVETTVTDNGIGIPAAVVENLFSKFYRSHKSRQVVGGTGLGLYLSKAIIDQHGGTIWVRSTEGEGSTFGFTLSPYANVADQLKSKDNTKGIIRGSHGWIKNHSLYRR